MRFCGWNALATSAALAAAVGAVAAPVAAAGSPVGEVVARDAREAPVVDDGHRLVFMASDGAVRLLDLSAAGSGGRELTRGCTPPNARRAVAAAAEGVALLDCLRTPPGAAGAYPAAHVLDLASGTLTLLDVPPALAAWDEIGFTGIDGAGVCFRASAYKSGSRSGSVDWRDGEIRDGATCSGTRETRDLRALTVAGPGGRPVALAPPPTAATTIPFAQADDEITTWAVRTLAPRMQLHAYLRRCGVRLSWETGPLTRAVLVSDGIVLAESTRGSGPATLRHVDLANACSRVSNAWRLQLALGTRRAHVLPRTARGGDPSTGAETGLLRPATASPTIRLGVRSVVVRPAAAARRVRWRIGAARWRTARRGSGGWVLQTNRHARGMRTLQLDVRFRNGARAGYEVAVR